MFLQEYFRHVRSIKFIAYLSVVVSGPHACSEGACGVGVCQYVSCKSECVWCECDASVCGVSVCVM